MSQFVMEERFETIKRVLDNRTQYMALCAENTFHPHNASALIRHCDAFGVQDFHTIESLCDFRPSKNVVQGTVNWIDPYRHSRTSEAIDYFRANGYRVVATTPHDSETTPELFDIEGGKFALIFGTELQGVSDEMIESADEFLKIPMYGFIDSLNVSASAAIVLHVLAQRLHSSEVDWQLSDNEYARLLLDWTMKTVRKSEKILMRYEQRG